VPLFWIAFRLFLYPAEPSDTWKILYNEGAQALEQGEPREAAAHFERALALDRNNPKILHGLLIAELACGRTGPALQSGQKLLRILRTQPDFNLSMAAGGAFARHTQFAEAVEFFKLAQAHAPPTINGRSSGNYFDTLLAGLFAQMKQDHEAVAALKRLVRSEPGEPSHYYQLGLIEIKNADFEDAYKMLQHALERFPSSFEIRLAYALACYFTGRNDLAERSYRQLIEIRPDSGQPYFALGNFYADTGRDTDAVQAFAQATRLEPNNYLNQYMYGVELIRTEKISPAASALRKAVKLNPKHADSYYWLGKIYLLEDRRDLALKAFETAVQLEPKHIGAYYQLALLYKRGGQIDKARAASQKRMELTQALHGGIVAERMAPVQDNK